MKALIIDRDQSAAEVLKTRLAALDYIADIEASHDRALGVLKTAPYDLILIDPAEADDVRQIVQDLRRIVGRAMYIFLLSTELTQDAAITAGANDVVSKPFDPDAFDVQVGNAARLSRVAALLADTGEDFPSAGGVISKSAFNQLFLSGIERAERYGERLFVLFIGLANYDDMLKFDGAQVANYAAAKLAQHMVNLRRQTDIIGQTRRYEFALLLQRPERESEPVQAAERFADALSDVTDLAMSEGIKIDIQVSLVGLPVGNEAAAFSVSL